jgi:hypothetical protein
LSYNGLDFSKELLWDWRRKHEDFIQSLLYTHRSPLPALRKFTEEGQLAQDIVDLLEQHGALFIDMMYERYEDVISSIDKLRSELKPFPPKIQYDSQLKSLIKDLIEACQVYMNHTSKFRSFHQNELENLRNRVGVILLRLENEYGCKVRGKLHRIIPR